MDQIANAVASRGEVMATDLARMVDARFWGPGRFGRALRQAQIEGRIRRVRRGVYAAPDQQAGQRAA